MTIDNDRLNQVLGQLEGAAKLLNDVPNSAPLFPVSPAPREKELPQAPSPRVQSTQQPTQRVIPKTQPPQPLIDEYLESEEEDLDDRDIETPNRQVMSSPGIPMITFIFESIGFTMPWAVIGWLCSVKGLGGTGFGKIIYFLLFSPITIGFTTVIATTYLTYKRRSSYLIVRLLQLIGAWAIAFHFHVHFFGGNK